MKTLRIAILFTFALAALAGASNLAHAQRVDLAFGISTVDAPGKKARLFEAVRTALRQVIGTYGIALVHADVPDFMIGARRGSPLVLGVGSGENFLASDVSAIVAYTRDAVYLNDFDVVAAGRSPLSVSSALARMTER